LFTWADQKMSWKWR